MLFVTTKYGSKIVTFPVNQVHTCTKINVYEIIHVPRIQHTKFFSSLYPNTSSIEKIA